MSSNIRLYIYLVIIIISAITASILINSNYMIANLYFANAAEDGFSVKKEIIKKKGLSETKIIEQIFEDLKLFSDGAEYFPAIPEGSEVIGAKIKNHILTIDFNENFVSKHPGGSRGELLTIYSVINSICYSIKYIKSVQIKIEGQFKETYKGHLDISKPLPPDKYILKNIQ